ncbi:pentatricopeptide repeat-containing protein At1g31430-like [Phragmites australis]|uniref:pentatricopeptide repeat-containing protein At1g31430-like n=1 Tax=Phragmites australis TaxID=29695 RepID=UPI002D792A5C|nr:pentatricopeptide repeat-containing protein At1g31430-like [Phragmites australis]
MAPKKIPFWRSHARLQSAHPAMATACQQSMPLRDCNVLIRTLARRGSFPRVMAVYYDLRARGLVADSFTYPFVLRAIGVLKLSVEGRKAHATAVKTGFRWDAYTASSLMEMYTMLGRSDVARKVFDEMPHRFLVLWNMMIRCYVRCTYFIAAVALAEEMGKSGVTPDRATLVTVVTACSRTGDLSLGRRIHSYMDGVFGFSLPVANALLDMYTKNAFLEEAVTLFEQMPERNIISWTILVSGYALAGHLDKARALFYQCTEKDLILWTAMINACVQLGSFEEALTLFRDMQMQRVEPDRFTVVTLLTCCANIGALDQGEWIHQYAEGRKMKIDAVLGTALIEMYSKCGHVDKALQVFGRMQGRDTAAWTAIICGLATNGQASRALELFEEMQISKAKPDGVTFIGILSACCHGGLVDEGRRHFQAMKEVYLIEPRIEHYSCLVNLLGRAGLVGEAEKLIGNMSVDRNTMPLFGALLTACKAHGNVEMSERLTKRIVEQDSQNPDVNVLMSNVYATASRWEDAIRVRSKMTHPTVKKTAGCSLIEVRGY